MNAKIAPRPRKRMWVNVDVEVDAAQVLEDLSDEELTEEFDRRSMSLKNGPFINGIAMRNLMERAYEQLRLHKTPVPQSVRDIFWESIGRIL